MDTREIIIDILEEMHSDVDFDTAEELVTGKILDSFDLVSLVALNSSIPITFGRIP